MWSCAVKFKSWVPWWDDILYALSHALGQAKRETGTTFHNAHVLKTAAKFISCYRDNPDALASTSNSTDSIVSKVHPDLWRFLQILTTAKQHAESMMQKQESPVRKVRTLYCLCHTVPYQPWMLLPTSSDFDWLDFESWWHKVTNYHLEQVWGSGLC